MTIEPKDVKKYLSLKGKIVVTGKSWSSITTNFLKKYKNGFKNKLSKLKEELLPTEEQIQEKLEEVREKKIEKIDEKRYELDRLKSALEDEDEYRIGENKYYLKEVKNELRKLDKKRINISKKGLSVFSISGLAISKIKNNINNKWKKYLENRNESKALKKSEKAKEQLLKNIEKLKVLKEEENNILNTYPELKDEEIIHTVTKIDDGKDIDTTESFIKVTQIKNPSKDEKEEIKKSSKFKQALAAMAVITGLAIGGMAISNTDVDINNTSKENTDDNIAQVQVETHEEKENVSSIIEDQKEEKTTLELGNYITIDNGSVIYETPTLNGNHGVIGQNGYNDETLFKVNAVTYLDNNNNEVSFNLVQKSEQSKKLTMEKYKKFIEQNPNAKIKNFHVTPCDELGMPVHGNELGGWTNSEKSKFENIDTNQITMDAYQNLGGKVI